MANKEFGIKEITLVGSSGSPTIQSPNNINLVANTVAISTNLTVGSDLTVSNNLTSNNITVSNLSITNVAGVTTIVNLNASTVNVSGVSTFAGITTVTGPALFTKQLSVSGVSTFNGNIRTNGSNIKLGDGNEVIGNQIKLGNGSGSPDAFGDSADLWIYHNSTYGNLLQDITGTGVEVWTGEFKVANPSNPSENVFYTNVNAGTELYYNRNKKFETIDAGVTVTGTTFTNQLSVSGVSTLSSNVSVGGTISVNGGVTLATNNPTIVGTSATAGEIKRIGGAPFFYDGNAWREFVLSSGTPVTQPADTEWDNVVFRATFDDDFTDAKFGATPVFVSAGSSIVGAAVTIGTGAYRNDGSIGAGISYAYRDEYDLTGSWTIEFWMYVDSGPVFNNPLSPVSLISMYSTTGIGTSGNWSLAMWRDQFANVYISWFNQNSPTYKSGAVLYNVAGSNWGDVIQDKWNHFTLVRESNNGSLHFYVNGIEQAQTVFTNVIDNDILNINGNGLHIGGDTTFTIGITTFNSNASADVIIDDLRISAGVGTAGQRYASIGISTYATFAPPTTQLPITGTLSSVVNPPGDKYGEITLGGSPTWRGTSGVTVTQQSSGNYRVSFASSYTNSNDYYVLSQGMDQGFASYVGIARSTTHVDLSINRQSNDAAVDTGSLAVQIKNHI
jgi:hypothetical protein